MQKKDSYYLKGIFYFLFLLALLACVAVLKILGSVCLPIILSILLSFAFYPLIRKLNLKFRIPWFFGILIVYVIFFLLVFGAGNLVANGVASILQALPRYQERFTSIYSEIAGRLDLPFDETLSLFDNLWNLLSIRTTVGKAAIGFTSGLYTFFKSFLLVVLFSVFLLLEMHFFKVKVLVAFSGNKKGRVQKITKKVIAEITQYISIKFIVSLATGILVTSGCLIINMDFPLVWGTIAFIMNFIPTFGSIISCALTVLFALIQFYPAPGPIIFIAIEVIAVNFIIGQVLEPRIEGKNLGLSPFVILTSLSFWGWMWGFLGLLISVPLMVIVKIICENISYLQPIAIFIGGRPQDTKKELVKDSDMLDFEEEDSPKTPTQTADEAKSDK